MCHMSQSSYNPLSEVTSYHHIRIESVNLTHTQKEGITRGCEYQETARSLEAALELSLPST